MSEILEIKNLIVEYTNLEDKKNKKTVAVNDVSFKIKQGEIYALAGESGCGKSTIAKAITKLITPKSGEIIFLGKKICEYKKYHKSVQMIFQNPYSSLNPKMKILDILKEPLDINTNFSSKDKIKLIKEVIKDVGLQDNCLELYPHEFSGGQRQRIAIARALILNPKLIIADEPVSALDASIQAQIINLLKDLKKKRNLTILFISHDLNVIKYLADRVGIMNKGKLIEENETFALFGLPKQEYTRNLINSAPKLII